MHTAISIISGGIITVLTAIWVEYLRNPRLKLTIEDPPFDMPAHGGNNRRRNLRVVLSNEALPFGVRWMQRAAATQCRGEITFHHLNDGQDIFGRAMPVRWVNSPEPIAPQIVEPNGTVRFHFLDFARTSTESRIDVYPGEEEKLDVSVRFDGEPDCYGWNNEAYVNSWRTPRWRLQPDRYLARVTITSSGKKCYGVFRIVNDVDNLTDFRLIEGNSDDRAKVL